MTRQLESILGAARLLQRTSVQQRISAFDWPDSDPADEDHIALNYGLPDEHLFPLPEVAEATERALRDHGGKTLQYGGASGSRRLCHFQASRLCTKWGMPHRVEEVLITSGASQAMDLIGFLLLEPGDEVWVEGPTYFGALQIFGMHDAKFLAFPMDADGLRVDMVEEELRWRRVEGGTFPKLFYTIPNYHNPTGLTLSLERRKHMATLAEEYGFTIVEDDAYGELGFATPHPPIISFAPHHTLYLSTFSKTIAPGFRIGSITASAAAIRALRALQFESGTNPLTQEIMANCLELLDYDAHVTHIRQAYQMRCQAMQRALTTYLSGNCSWNEPSGGFFIWVTLPQNVSVNRLWQIALRKSVSFVGGCSFYTTEEGNHQLRLSFSYYTPEILREGIRRLKDALTSYAGTDIG